MLNSNYTGQVGLPLPPPLPHKLVLAREGHKQDGERFECQVHELYAACRISNDYGVMAVVDGATQIQKRLRGLLRRRVLIACGPVIRGLHLHPGVSTVTSDAVDVGFSAPTPPIPLVTAAKFRFESSQYWEEAGSAGDSVNPNR